MAEGARCYTLVAMACIALPACSSAMHTRLDTHAPGMPAPETPEQAIDPALDHFVARVPLRLAETAIQAQAMTHVAVGRARQQAGGSGPCGKTWLLTGPVSGSIPSSSLLPGFPSRYPGQVMKSTFSRNLRLLCLNITIVRLQKLITSLAPPLPGHLCTGLR